MTPSRHQCQAFTILGQKDSRHIVINVRKVMRLSRCLCDLHLWICNVCDVPISQVFCLNSPWAWNLLCFLQVDKSSCFFQLVEQLQTFVDQQNVEQRTDDSFQGHWWHHSWPNVGAQGRGWRSYGCWAAWLMLIWGHSNVFSTVYNLEVNSKTQSAA